MLYPALIAAISDAVHPAMPARAQYLSLLKVVSGAVAAEPAAMTAGEGLCEGSGAERAT